MKPSSQAFFSLIDLAKIHGRISIDYVPEWDEGPLRLLAGGDDGCEPELLISGDMTEISRMLPELALTEDPEVAL